MTLLICFGKLPFYKTGKKYLKVKDNKFNPVGKKYLKAKRKQIVNSKIKTNKTYIFDRIPTHIISIKKKEQF